MDKDGMDGVEQHLLFHKALIDDSVGSEKIDRYIGVLKESGPGETMNDPVDESIRSAFSLVLEHSMDPWCINIVEFARMYSVKKVRNAVDIIVAGKLIHMAWKILRMQSDITLEEGERLDPFGDDGWDMDFDLDVMNEPEKLYVPDIEFREAIRRNPTRSVTMMELLDAFEDAREEMELQMAREQARLELKAKEPRKFDNKAHEEDDERDVERVWSVIENLGTGPLPIRDLYVDDVRTNITTFVSVLHLVRDGRLTIWQDNMPYGEIFVEIKIDWSDGVVEDSPELVNRAVV
ncbi:MAG: chromosome segregation protein ScpA [Methanomassiliicoccaceae archaeon]|nr:chromosome segregation protein ScpA [Methanomassiliicoccaceae archaeon]